ncbi:hypothetical protein [Pseudobacter ginsenosidimutans]|uniref:Uncharacterized protein n=1 Tax=Pseudobacter ginsenosidimutans TaxID=661488 RepID=A0A4Q7MYK1_9BACT|nr:hypothetical protein [Pseudobacter ginsenosidimutans]QEC40955.1 hypothetical protein FSB84_04320 [Pseudobacter ginsenosidimutans]RZS72303.1 hypothetical protein EV199_4221 [Pseudobacter ginsenosidimutans]
MNKLLLTSLFLLSLSASFAQKNDFDIVSYAIPSDYELIKNNSVITYFKEDKSTGAYCNIFIYALIDGKGDIQKDFDYSWDNLVQKPFKFSSNANLQPVATLKGWKFLMGSAKYSDNGIATLAMLFTFSGESSMQSICILSNADRYKADIENFIASVNLNREAGIINANMSSSKSPGSDIAPALQQTTTSPLNDKSPKPEVWMKSRFEYDMMKRMSETKYEWIAIYPDEKFYPYMPSEGYAGFYNKNKDWGSAKWNGNRLNVAAQNTSYYFDKKSASTMQSKFDSKPNFYKCKPVNGLRIEGAYTQYASLIPSSTNEPQYLIWFYKDGRFDDRGISVVDLKNPNAFASDAPGKGKYTIETFSIFLRYDDGRIKQLGFSGFLDKDPATVTDAYFIGRHLYYRKDKGHNSNLNKINY